MKDFELNKALAEALGLTFYIENEELYVYEKPEVSTVLETFERIWTFDNAMRIYSIQFDALNNWNAFSI